MAAAWAAKPPAATTKRAILIGHQTAYIIAVAICVCINPARWSDLSFGHAHTAMSVIQVAKTNADTRVVTTSDTRTAMSTGGRIDPIRTVSANVTKNRTRSAIASGTTRNLLNVRSSQ